MEITEIALVGAHPVTGNSVFRKRKSFEANENTNFIQVFYEEYQKSSNGAIIQHDVKKYNCKDFSAVNYSTTEIKVEATYYDGSEIKEPATYYVTGDTLPDGVNVGDLKTSAIYWNSGDEKTPAEYYDGTEIKVAAVTKFYQWWNFIITQSMVGMTMSDLLNSYIDYTLSVLPIGIKDDYNVGTPIILE